MPWHLQPKKDAINSEMPRGVVNRQRSGDVRIGKPVIGNTMTTQVTGPDVGNPANWNILVAGGKENKSDFPK